MGTEVQFGKMKTALEMDGDDCRIMRMFLLPQNCTLKNCKDGKFYYVYFITIKNIPMQ